MLHLLLQPSHCMGRVYSNFTICFKARWFQVKKKKKDGDPSVHRGLVLVFILYGERTRDDAVLMDDTLQNFLSHMYLLFYIRSSSFQVHLPFDTFLFFALLASPLSCL